MVLSKRSIRALRDLEQVLPGRAIEPGPTWLRPAHPGQCAVQYLYPDPRTGEIIRAYRKRVHSILYRKANGDLFPYTPRDDGGNDQAFHVLARAQCLTLITRPERRKMWREERTRYKVAQKNERARQRAEGGI